jgi:hypothetical protein
MNTIKPLYKNTMLLKTLSNPEAVEGRNQKKSKQTTLFAGIEL